MGIPGLPLGSPGTKCDLDVAPMEKCREPQRRGGGQQPLAMEKCREYYKWEGGGFPQDWGVVSLMSSRSLVAHLNTQKCTNYALTNVLFGLC